MVLALGSWSIFLIVASWAIRMVMLPIVVMRKPKPITCLAWLAVIFFQPWVGLILYLAVGENRLGYRRIRRHVKHATALRDTATRSPGLRDYLVRPDVAPNQQILAHVAEGLGGLPILGGNGVELMIDSQQVITRLIEDIDQAEHHVHLLFYIFGGDATANAVADAMVRAVKRGVHCRLLADGVGSRKMLRWRARELIALGIEVANFLPANPIRRHLARFDLRNHRKIVVIDGRIAYTGSQNIVNADYGYGPRGAGPWRDIMTRIVGPSVTQLQGVFMEDWEFATQDVLEDEGLFPESLAAGNVALQAVPSGPNYPTAVLADVVVEAIFAARERVILTTPYFVPDESIITALRLAVMRGARVDLVIPMHTNHNLVDWVGHFYCHQLTQDGVHVHMHKSGLLHAKTLTVDDGLAMVGSANFDVRSFLLNFELNVLFYDAAVTDSLRNHQLQFLSESVEIVASAWQSRSRWERLGENFAKLLSPLL
jgi:cardiolipin synthase A/B